VNHYTLLDLSTFGDARGTLTVLDSVLPFAIARVYWIYAADGQTRGGHRHRKTRQALIAMSGSIVIHMDDGTRKEDINLDSPHQCLLVEPKDWHTMTFGAGSILLVVSSEHYDRSDYIDQKYPESADD
jgi:dTDP-4-dehydrorhamnose 3,5-epimerase-like enzyme